MTRRIQEAYEATHAIEVELDELTPGSVAYQEKLEALEDAISDYHSILYDDRGEIYGYSERKNLMKNAQLARELRISIEDAAWRRSKTLA